MHLFTGTEPKFGIVCECDDAGCNERLIVRVSEYERVRSDPRLFLVVAGHEDRRIEQVVRTGDSFRVVRKTGAAGEVAEETAN